MNLRRPQIPFATPTGWALPEIPMAFCYITVLLTVAYLIWHQYEQDIKRIYKNLMLDMRVYDGELVRVGKHAYIRVYGLDSIWDLEKLGRVPEQPTTDKKKLV